VPFRYRKKRRAGRFHRVKVLGPKKVGGLLGTGGQETLEERRWWDEEPMTELLGEQKKSVIVIIRPKAEGNWNPRKDEA